MIEGHVLHDMVKAFQAFLDICYIACQKKNVQDTQSLTALSDVLEHFHKYHAMNVVFRWMDLPYQDNSLIHYVALIHVFGAPNGHCSSITESKHIKAVKEPWCHSSWYKVLGQMLLTNQWMNKLAASHVNFAKNGMLKGTCLENSLVAVSKCYICL